MSETISNLISRAPLTQEERDAAAAGMVRKALGYRLASEVDPALSRPDLTADRKSVV